MFLQFFKRATFSVLLITLTSCSSYYLVTKKSPDDIAQNFTTNQYDYRYFILRNGSNAYYMDSVRISDDKKMMHCFLKGLPTEHQLHLTNGINGKRRYENSVTGKVVLNEIHLYVRADTTAKPGTEYMLALNKIEKVEVIEKDKDRTTKSHVLGWGIGILSVGIVALLIAGASVASAF